MDSPVHDENGLPEPARELSDESLDLEGSSWLDDIVDLLDNNPEECSQAIETLEMLEPDLRISIIEELSGLGDRPGAERLLRLLSTAADDATRSAAIVALERLDTASRALVPAALSEPDQEIGNGPEDAGDRRSLTKTAVALGRIPRLAGCLVTPVDGKGRGSIVVSVIRGNERRTGAFLCDVRLGIRDVVGEIEPESPQAGGLIDALERQPGGVCARDVPEFALGLLSGSLMLCEPAVPLRVRNWLDESLGTSFQPAPFPATIPGLDASSLHQAELPGRAAELLEACPSWRDSSPLTFELAEEIWLREGRFTAQPERDAGAYRFLFEHRLIHRLDMYQRMLLWMAWLWKFRDEIELSRSALALACQLADDQFAVPSHPFTVELTTRSLEAAQRQLRQTADRTH